jgi:hypothetical protein
LISSIHQAGSYHTLLLTLCEYQHARSHIRAAAHVVYEAYHKDGGHFAAHERPEKLIADLHAMFKRGGPAYGVVNGATGYPLHTKL